MVALQVQGFCWILVIFLAPIIPRIGLYGLKYKAFSIIQCTLCSRNFILLPRRDPESGHEGDQRAWRQGAVKDYQPKPQHFLVAHFYMPLKNNHS